MATHEILNMLPFLGFLITDSLAGLSFCFTLMSSRLEKLKEQIKVMDKFQSSKWKAKTSKCVWDESSVSGFSRYIHIYIYKMKRPVESNNCFNHAKP